MWICDFGGDPNIVEVYVGRIRRKLGDPFGTRHIVTVRGVGYRLDGGDGLSADCAPGRSRRGSP